MPDVVAHLKEAYSLVEKYNDVPLMKAILEARDEVFHLREENRELKERIRKLEEEAKIGGELKRRQNVYYRFSPDGRVTGPFCMTCWDGDSKLVNMLVNSMEGKANCT